MKQRVNFQFWWWGLAVIVALAGLNLGKQTKAQTLHSTDTVLLSQKTDNTSSTISAHDLFRNAYENRYTWNPQFPGYTAAVEFKLGKENYKGRVRVNPDMTVEVTGIDKEDARQIVENQLLMFASHRRRVSFKEAHKNSTFKLGATDRTGAVEIFEQGGKTEAHYKVFRQQVMQVNRILGPHAVTVDTLDSEITPEGYLATRYRTTFHHSQTKQLLGEEESKDTYEKIGGYYVLTRRVIDSLEQGQRFNAEFNFTDIQLVSGKG